MNILIVSQTYIPEIGAAPTRLSNLAEGLAKYGHKISVLTSMPNYPKGKIFDEYRGKISIKESINGVDIYRYWIFATNSIKPFVRLWALISYAFILWSFSIKRNFIKYKIDIVIIQSPQIIPAYSAILLFKKLYHKKIIVNISDLQPSSLIDSGLINPNGIYYKILLSVEKSIYNNANAIVGQSNEIIDHIRNIKSESDYFLYRNLQPINFCKSYKTHEKKNKIVYAGLFGISQDILSIVKCIDYSLLNIELHLYGDGAQKEEIVNLINNGKKNVFYHGVLNKDDMTRELSNYQLAIVPLAANEKGAVPSKIFDLIRVGIPIIYSGNINGEAANIIKDNKIGYVGPASDYEALTKNIIKFNSLSQDDYSQMVDNCYSLAKGIFNFESQLLKFNQFLEIVKA